MRIDVRNSAAIPIVTCGVVAVVVACLAVAPQLRSAGWSLSALPRVAATTDLGALARRVDPGFHTVRSGAYDGQFYWGVAVDPLATGPAHRVFDKASYRYGHPLYGWLAWAVSGGQAQAVPAALFLLGLASLFAAAALAAALGRARGGTGWEGLLIALNPGLVIATGEDLAEPLAAAVALAAIAALVAGRRAVAWFCLALLPFAKEPLVLVIVAVVVYELAHRNPRRAAVFATAAIPVCVWWTYARFQLGAWFTSGDSALGPPLLGWWRALAGPFTTAPGLLAHHGVGRVIADVLARHPARAASRRRSRRHAGVRAGRARVPGARGSRAVPRPERDGFRRDGAPEHGVPRCAGALRDRGAATLAAFAVTRTRRLIRGRPVRVSGPARPRPVGARGMRSSPRRTLRARPRR